MLSQIFVLEGGQENKLKLYPTVSRDFKNITTIFNGNYTVNSQLKLASLMIFSIFKKGGYSFSKVWQKLP